MVTIEFDMCLWILTLKASVGLILSPCLRMLKIFSAEVPCQSILWFGVDANILSSLSE